MKNSASIDTQLKYKNLARFLKDTEDDSSFGDFHYQCGFEDEVIDDLLKVFDEIKTVKINEFSYDLIKTSENFMYVGLNQLYANYMPGNTPGLSLNKNLDGIYSLMDSDGNIIDNIDIKKDQFLRSAEVIYATKADVDLSHNSLKLNEMALKFTIDTNNTTRFKNEYYTIRKYLEKTDFTSMNLNQGLLEIKSLISIKSNKVNRKALTIFKNLGLRRH